MSILFLNLLNNYLTMIVKQWFIFILFCISLNSNAQDVLYTSKGAKIEAKLTEINASDIKYKEFTNLDGPVYVISKSEIVLIQYANGTTQVINQSPSNYSPKKESQVFTSNESKEVKKKPLDLYYMNSNLISVNALSLANGDATIIYDKELFKSKMSLSFLVGYNFNSRMGALNLYVADSKSAAKKNYDIGLGINYMPRNTKRVQYFVGFLGKYMSYNYDKVTQIVNNQKMYEKSSANQVSLMIANGWIYRISPFFNFKIFGAIGGQINSVPLDYTNSNGRNVNYSNSPKVYLGYCFGYRF